MNPDLLADLRRARRLLFITGAGVSAESGLPTYRGVGGLYEGITTPDALPIEEALSGPMLRQDPALVWKYIHEIEASCRGARPNKAHEIIAALEGRYEVAVLTQNVDGFHRAAGSTDCIEIHGNIHGLRCTECDWEASVPDYANLDPVPHCPKGHVARPDVVLFGEMLPADAIAHYESALRWPFDLVFSIGTTSVFPYIAEPIRQARCPTVEINPGHSEVSRLVTHRIRSGAVEALSALFEALSA